jgi:hypothetical protein
MHRQKNLINKNYVDYDLNYAPLTSTKALLQLHYITFCVSPLHSTFSYLVLPPAHCGHTRSSPGWSCTPRPATPQPRPITASHATQRPSPRWLQPGAPQSPLAAPWPWPVVPWLYQGRGWS